MTGGVWKTLSKSVFVTQLASLHLLTDRPNRKLEKATKKRRGGRISMPAPGSTEKWLERTLAIFSSIETILTPSPSRTAAILPPFTKTLRTRKTPASVTGSTAVSPKKSGEGKQEKEEAAIDIIAETTVALAGLTVVDATVSSDPAVEGSAQAAVNIETIRSDDPLAPRKLPRVILRVRDPNDAPKNI